MSTLQWLLALHVTGAFFLLGGVIFATILSVLGQRAERPSELAARFFGEDHVVEVRIHNDRRGLLVKTRDPNRFYLLMNRVALDGFAVESVAPCDDDVNSVYEYLIGTQEATR